MPQFGTLQHLTSRETPLRAGAFRHTTSALLTSRRARYDFAQATEISYTLFGEK